MSDSAVSALSTALARLRHQEVRAIVAALGLGRRADQNQKDAWVAAIAAAWLDPVQREAQLARLSPAAHAALWRLVQGGELPTLLFLNEYGPLRLPGDSGRATAPSPPPLADEWSELVASATPSTDEPPWRAPQTVCEELFYAGLLLPKTAQPIREAPRLELPWVLRVPLTHWGPEQLGFSALYRQTPDPLPAQPIALLHDLGQFLIYLAQRGSSRCARGVGSRRVSCKRSMNGYCSHPPPSCSRRTKARIGQPYSAFWLTPPAYKPRANSPRRLAVAGGGAGAATARAVEWLATGRPCAARHAYGQPLDELPAPWPELVFDYLEEEIFAPAWLTAVLLGMEEEWHSYFVAHLPTLRALDIAHAQLLALLYHDFDAIAPAYLLDERRLPAHPSGIGITGATQFDGVLDGAAADDLPPYDQPPYLQIGYQLTALGRWLLEPEAQQAPGWRWQLHATLTEQADGLMITLPINAAPLPQAQLAPFADCPPARQGAEWAVYSGVHKTLFRFNPIN
ncbi:MAG: hypothetical protein R3C14_32260 [Caldilineaceae bacterium]